MSKKNEQESDFDFSTLSDSIEENFQKQAKKTINEIDEAKLVFCLVGNVNAGKSQFVNTILRDKIAKVGPVAGLTKKVTIYEHPHIKNVFLADSPGLEDVNEQISDKTQTFIIKNANALLFFINASVGVTKTERDAYIHFKNILKLPIIPVISKIDTLDDEDLPILINDVKEKLDIPKDGAIYPISCKTGIGVEELSIAFSNYLSDAQKAKFARITNISKVRDDSVDKWITAAAAAAFGIGVVPIPGSDIIPLTILQVGLITKIAYVYDVEITKKEAMVLITETVAGQVGKAVFRTALKAAGWVFGPIGGFITAGIAGAVAGGLTFGLGKAAKAYYRSGMRISTEELREIFEISQKEYKKMKKLKESN